ncbi:MAG: hypothetical protein M3Q83_03565 [Pseudomonadota bacterium]|nr:hypothetical protein [Pseudomonadota bacterium]
MNLGRFPTRYEKWRRTSALLVLLGLVAALLIAAWPAPSSPQPKVRASDAEQSDLQLYRDIIARVGAGEPYYPVAADELRQGGYPLQPFITFRLPTLAYAYALIPELITSIIEGLLALSVLLVWWRRLDSHLSFWPLAIALVLMVGGTATLVEPVTGLFHESWAALLMALMIGLRRPGQAAGAIVAGGLALLVRETALPMILAMGGLALLERRWREALGWAGVVLVFAAALALHAQMVATVVRPDDLASPGWNALLGVRFALAAFAAVSSATVLPKALAAIVIVLSLFGWASVRTGWALRATILLFGYGAMLALFARADTFYWALLVAPLSLTGLVFVPRAIAELVRASRGMRHSAA